MIDPKTLSPGVLRALQACVAGAQRFGPLLGGLIDPEATERLAEALRVEATPINPLAYVGVAGSRLPDGARWAIALSAMYTIAQRGTDATLAPAQARPAQSLAILRDYWGVGDEAPEARRAQTIDRLEWLLNRGDRADPQCAEPGDPEAPIDLLAWDLARAAMTVRHACQAECLSESEAWSYLLTIAVKAQESFEFLARLRRSLSSRANPLVERDARPLRRHSRFSRRRSALALADSFVAVASRREQRARRGRRRPSVATQRLRLRPLAATQPLSNANGGAARRSVDRPRLGGGAADAPTADRRGAGAGDCG